MREEELQAVLWEIVHELAAEERGRYVYSQAYTGCPFCDSDENHRALDGVTHEPDCIVTKARKLAEKGILADL